MLNYTKYKATSIQKQEELAFIIELTDDDDRPFYEILLEAMDKSFLALGETVKKSIYRYLENSMQIKKSEIPFRIYDFQNALEKLFGAGTRHIEILIIKNLNEKVKIIYKEDMPSWVVPDLTFQEYICSVKMAYEKSNMKNRVLNICTERTY